MAEVDWKERIRNANMNAYSEYAGSEQAAKPDTTPPWGAGKHENVLTQVSEQTKLESAVETGVNYVIGFAIAWATFQYLIPVLAYYFPQIFPYVESSFHKSIAVTMLYTLISVGRTYTVRRFFARGLHKVVHAAVAALLRAGVLRLNGKRNGR